MTRRKRHRRPIQLTLDQARRPTGRGGWRPGAGRPRGPTTHAHARRPIIGGLPSLRRERVVRVVRAAIAAGGHRDDFRVVHFNVLGNHLHLLGEATGQPALARGMQGLGVQLARSINTLFERVGRLFAQRYHARALRTPREVRSALRYVLLNGRHHAAERGQVLARGWIDPFSSALWFDGWREAIRTDAPWLRALQRIQCPTASAATWLLKGGWRRGGGPIAVDDIPGRPGP